MIRGVPATFDPVKTMLIGEDDHNKQDAEHESNSTTCPEMVIGLFTRVFDMSSEHRV